MTAIPHVIQSTTTLDRKREEIKKLLTAYSPVLRGIRKQFGPQITTAIVECINLPNVLATLEYWERKLRTIPRKNFNKQDFLFSKLLEMGAFYLGAKNMVKTLKKELKQILRTPKLSEKCRSIRSIQSKNCVTCSKNGETSGNEICFVIPAHVRNTNANRMFNRMLISLARQEHPPSQVIIIDDASLEPLVIPKSIFPKLVLRKSKEVRGPAFSRNWGAELALEGDYDFVVFADSDMVFPKDWIKRLKGAVLTRKGDIFSGLNLAYGNTWWDFYHDANGTLNGRVYVNRRELFFATTATLIVKATVLERIQFNEIFETAAGEDIDFCLQARNLGFKIVLVDELRVKHDYGYKNLPHDDLEIFLKRCVRYGSAEPLLVALHSCYYAELSKTREISVLEGWYSKDIPDFPCLLP